MLTIKVLGSGCPNCKKLEALAKKAVEDQGLQATFVKVTNYNDMLAYNIMSTPGLVINEKLVSSGRIPKPEEIAGWLQAAVAAEG